jgi:type IV pilus assembly protein PilQ
LINRLDVVVSQVLIEAKVVTINTDYDQEIGVRLGVTRDKSFTGNITQAGNVDAEGIPIADRMNFSLPASNTHQAGGAATAALTLFKLDHRTLLDLELSALEKEGKGKIISSPRLVTSNQQKAMIQAGEEIPYEESTSSGATNIAFKKAVLSLTVTPRITPNNKIILDLKVTEDKRGEEAFTGGPPAIDTQEIETQVLLDDGETVVLGGVYKHNKTENVSRVPFLGKVPLVGRLFRNTHSVNDKDELLIFITPKILKNN